MNDLLFPWFTRAAPVQALRPERPDPRVIRIRELEQEHPKWTVPIKTPDGLLQPLLGLIMRGETVVCNINSREPLPCGDFDSLFGIMVGTNRNHERCACTCLTI